MNSKRILPRRLLTALALLGTAAAALGTSPPQAGLQRGKVLLENDRVLVVEGTIAPGETTGMHKHALPTVVICLEGGTLREVLPGGDANTYERKAGEVVWRDKDFLHNETNIGKSRLRVIAVQLKPGTKL